MPLEPRSKDDVQRAAFGLRRGSVSLGQERLCSAEGSEGRAGSAGGSLHWPAFPRIFTISGSIIHYIM